MHDGTTYQFKIMALALPSSPLSAMLCHIRSCISSWSVITTGAVTAQALATARPTRPPPAPSSRLEREPSAFPEFVAVKGEPPKSTDQMMATGGCRAGACMLGGHRANPLASSCRTTLQTFLTRR